MNFLSHLSTRYKMSCITKVVKKYKAKEHTAQEAVALIKEMVKDEDTEDTRPHTD